MARSRRLRRGREFDRMYREGRLIRGALLVLRVADRPDGPARWGFVASKKVAPLAVDRNRLRRVLKGHAGTLAVRSGVDIVAAVGRSGSTAAPERLRHELSQLLQRAGLLEAAP